MGDPVDARLKASLGAGLAAAAAAEPALVFDTLALLDVLEARAATSTDADGDPSALHFADLALAYSAATGCPEGVLRVTNLVGQVAASLRPKFANVPEGWDDLVQRFMEALVVGGERPRKLLDYAGRGDLRAFLRVSMGRFVLNVVAREGREEPEDLPFFEALSDGGADAEVAYLKAACRAELKVSLEVAARALEARDRVLLRYTYADGRTVAEIGAVYGVHGATASRWVLRARARLAELVYADLTERLKMSGSDAQSLLRSAMSEVELTLQRLLATGS